MFIAPPGRTLSLPPPSPNRALTNESASPPGRSCGSFVSALNDRINGRKNCRYLYEACFNSKGKITKESTPGILTNHFCYHRINGLVCSSSFWVSSVLFFLSFFFNTSYTYNISFLLLFRFVTPVLYIWTKWCWFYILIDLLLCLPYWFYVFFNGGNMPY